MIIDNTSEKQFIYGVILNISVCMYVFMNQDQSYGLVLALLLIIAIDIMLAIWAFDRNIEKCVEKLSLIPLCLIFTSSLPWFYISPSFHVPGKYTAVLFICGLQIYQESISLDELGLEKGILPLGAFLVISLVISELYGNYLFRDLFSMILFKGTSEELLYRAMIQKNLKSVMGTPWSIIITSLLFTVTHITWLSVPELVITFCLGFGLGMLYEKSGNLLGPIFIHGVCTAIMGL